MNLIINNEFSLIPTLPVNKYMITVNERNFSRSCEVYSKLTMKTRRTFLGREPTSH